MFEAWKQGRTGFPIVDAGMRQLLHTGFMHNRIRMIVASFLVKDLHLPWQWGARWFMDQLVDGDVASNHAAAVRREHRRRPVLPGVQPHGPGCEVRPGRRLRAALGAGTGRYPGCADKTQGAGPPAGYPEPIVDHAAERLEALRRYNR